MATDNQLIIGEIVYSIDSVILGFDIKQKPSSNIAFYGYDDKYKRLFIQFKNSNCYIYENVEADIFNDLDKSISIGKHFSQHIAGRYQHIKFSQPLIIKEGLLA